MQNCKMRPLVSVITASRRGRKQENLGEQNLFFVVMENISPYTYGSISVRLSYCTTLQILLIGVWSLWLHCLKLQKLLNRLVRTVMFCPYSLPIYF